MLIGFGYLVYWMASHPQPPCVHTEEHWYRGFYNVKVCVDPN